MSDEGVTNLVAWNMARQIAIDRDDNIWHVDMWMDADGDEITDRFANPDQLLRDNTPNVHEENWEFVEAVTAYHDFPEGRKWVTFRPDAFDRPSEG